jgi:hypothetical protein
MVAAPAAMASHSPSNGSATQMTPEHFPSSTKMATERLAASAQVSKPTAK